MWARGMDDFARRASEALRWGVPMGDDVVDGVDGVDGVEGCAARRCDGVERTRFERTAQDRRHRADAGKRTLSCCSSLRARMAMSFENLVVDSSNGAGSGVA